MNRSKLRSIGVLLLVGVLVLLPTAVQSWGFYAHRQINKLAVFTLPQEMLGFYKKHIDFIEEHAVDPDKRRYGVEGEAPRHYIDIDYYCKGKVHCNPFLLMPRSWYEAKEKFTEDTLQAYGIVPWHIAVMVNRLTDAMKAGDASRILRTSAELGHYVGDAHVPLHTTENYNGQLTGQKGIHGFWESRLPELYDDDYSFFVGRAKYISNPRDAAWEIVEASHAALDSVLRFEAELNKSWPADQKYSYEERGRVISQVYSEGYSRAYHLKLNGQVERRMREAVIMTGSFWYTAWVNAGQPDLDKLDLPKEEELLTAPALVLDSLPQKIRTRPHDN
jgi:hypothetical protein